MEINTVAIINEAVVYIFIGADRETNKEYSADQINAITNNKKYLESNKLKKPILIEIEAIKIAIQINLLRVELFFEIEKCKIAHIVENMVTIVMITINKRIVNI